MQSVAEHGDGKNTESPSSLMPMIGIVSGVNSPITYSALQAISTKVSTGRAGMKIQSHRRSFH